MGMQKCECFNIWAAPNKTSWYIIQSRVQPFSRLTFTAHSLPESNNHPENYDEFVATESDFLCPYRSTCLTFYVNIESTSGQVCINYTYQTSHFDHPITWYIKAGKKKNQDSLSTVASEIGCPSAIKVHLRTFVVEDIMENQRKYETAGIEFS